MEARGRILLGVLALVLSTGIGGCQSNWMLHDANLGMSRDEHHETRSTALPSKHVRVLGLAHGAEPDAWYASRNDAQLTVEAGHRSAIYDAQYTFTRDQQYISNGRVRDHYNQRTYRTSVVESRR